MERHPAPQDFAQAAGVEGLACYEVGDQGDAEAGFCHLPDGVGVIDAEGAVDRHGFCFSATTARAEAPALLVAEVGVDEAVVLAEVRRLLREATAT